MRRLVIFALIGFAAQLVDGTLGMSYGVTSTSLLLMFGIAPAVASASVHMAEVVTTAASGISHIRFGNVDKQVVRKLILPGSIGAFLGACFLGSIPGEIIKPFVSTFLLLLGIFVMYRFLFHRNQPSKIANTKRNHKHLISLGFIAGFFDATGGGGWGPIATPVLMTKNDMEPRKVIGSVDTSEFAIALSSTIGFLLTIGWSQINIQWVIAFMIGGLIAAPIAAWLVKIIPTNLLGALVGGMIIITNIRTLLGALNASYITSLYTYVVLSILWIFALGNVIWKLKKESCQNESRRLNSY
ncbi:sulfite exporter TauE/SafE family protein [Calidifontibacillus erzurumensis]|uniref:Probable membrane transporter protein n=1 Tax=Calidifontibacillus erzurumensis TaxID=2741433 RepID=A0A8J8GG44_9BACI|nr:sulfite exporter TauE/SafE family protein [Calidifontibacillus erzurumensis]NSL52511.1 sulfite exporter TauE/SafE family protein [Calidifontibacillus erzurumensis]